MRLFFFLSVALSLLRINRIYFYYQLFCLVPPFHLSAALLCCAAYIYTFIFFYGTKQLQNGKFI